MSNLESCTMLNMRNVFLYSTLGGWYVFTRWVSDLYPPLAFFILNLNHPRPLFTLRNLEFYPWNFQCDILKVFKTSQCAFAATFCDLMIFLFHIFTRFALSFSLPSPLPSKYFLALSMIFFCMAPGKNIATREVSEFARSKWEIVCNMCWLCVSVSQTTDTPCTGPNSTVLVLNSGYEGLLMCIA